VSIDVKPGGLASWPNRFDVFLERTCVASAVHCSTGLSKVTSEVLSPFVYSLPFCVVAFGGARHLCSAAKRQKSVCVYVDAIVY
jgi:hypothetical protein